MISCHVMDIIVSTIQEISSSVNVTIVKPAYRDRQLLNRELPSLKYSQILYSRLRGGQNGRSLGTKLGLTMNVLHL